jgi:16S rRNA (uracil1498-N3)-methyltransferase
LRQSGQIPYRQFAPTAQLNNRNREMAARFYINEVPMLGSLVLEGPEAHHLAHVRRVNVGDEVTLFCGDGKEYRSQIVSIGKRDVELKVVAIDQSNRELGFQLHIASALPKGDRLDILIEKLTELGATDFTPLLAERSVVIAKESQRERLERAVIEASKQCGRNVLMRIHAPIAFAKWCESADLPTNKWIAQPGGESIAAQQARCDGFAIAIGPEGGFTDQELATACSAGFRMVSLGPRILRVETAALVLAAVAYMKSPDVLSLPSAPTSSAPPA